MVRGGYAPVAGTYGVPIRLMQTLYGAAAEGLMIKNLLKKSSENPSMPKPWFTDRPKNAVPKKLSTSDNGSHFPKGSPNGKAKEFIKWGVRIGGSAALAKKIYDTINIEYNYSKMPQDNTKVYKPLYEPKP